MKKNTRMEIIQAAKKLFNEGGYNDVSTKDIADAIGISKGNLNYHFKRKEDIVEAVVAEMHSHYVKAEPPTTLRELNTLFVRVQEVAKENAFYFWHYTQLAQMSMGIREIQNKVIGDNYRLFSESFNLLIGKGSLQSPHYPGQYEQIVKAVMLVCTYWIPHSRIAESMEIKGSFLDCVWGIIYPLLTEKGRLQYNLLKDNSAQNQRSGMD